MGLQSADRGQHVARQVVLYNPRSHLNYIYILLKLHKHLGGYV